MDRSVYGSITSNPAGSESFGTYEEVSSSTPGFHRLRKLGKQLPAKDYLWRRIDAKDPYTEFIPDGQSSKRRERDASGNHFCYNAWRNGSFQRSALLVTDCPTIQTNGHIVSNRLLDKIRDQDIDLGVSLGERRETAQFLVSSMTKTVKSFRAFRKGNVSEALRVLTGRRNSDWRDIPGVASNAWLAYTFGLRPLVNDVYSAMKVLSKPDNETVVVKRVRSGVKSSYDKTVIPFGNWFTHMRYEVKTRGEIGFVVDNPLIRTLDQLGLTNPLNVAWELMPFSFVVDWFYPVGKAIQSIVPPQGVLFVDGWVSHKCNGSVIHRYLPWGTRLETREVEKQRVILKDFPSYRVVVPDLSLSNQQITSGLALLFQVSTWGKQKQRVVPERFPRENRKWTEQWPNDPWWSR